MIFLIKNYQKPIERHGKHLILHGRPSVFIGKVADAAHCLSVIPFQKEVIGQGWLKEMISPWKNKAFREKHSQTAQETPEVQALGAKQPLLTQETPEKITLYKEGGQKQDDI